MQRLIVYNKGVFRDGAKHAFVMGYITLCKGEVLWYQELNLLGHDADVDGLGVAMVCAAVKAQGGMTELCKFDMAGAPHFYTAVTQKTSCEQQPQSMKYLKYGRL